VHVGTLAVTAGRESKHLATLEPGAFFGEIALLKNAKRNATITAYEKTEYVGGLFRGF
jgi:CRP-like cAMP-binding protein